MAFTKTLSGLTLAGMLLVPSIGIAQNFAAVQSMADAGLSDNQMGYAIVEPFIVGGAPVTDIDNVPWQVALVQADTQLQFCGGSIIAAKWVLTAAHCVDHPFFGLTKPEDIDIIAGTLTYQSGGQQIEVVGISLHPNWDAGILDFDAALIELAEPLTVGSPVALAQNHTGVAIGTDTLVSGWGATREGGSGSLTLLSANVPVVETTVCNEPASYNGEITDAMLCAGVREGGRDACQGDSGGPLVASFNGVDTLVGIVSWGEGCARRLKYGVYTRVTAISTWVTQTAGL